MASTHGRPEAADQYGTNTALRAIEVGGGQAHFQGACTMVGPARSRDDGLGKGRRNKSTGANQPSEGLRCKVHATGLGQK